MKSNIRHVFDGHGYHRLIVKVGGEDVAGPGTDHHSPALWPDEDNPELMAFTDYFGESVFEVQRVPDQNVETKEEL
jgi:hypothetical protein